MGNGKVVWECTTFAARVSGRVPQRGGLLRKRRDICAPQRERGRARADAPAAMAPGSRAQGRRQAASKAVSSGGGGGGGGGGRPGAAARGRAAALQRAALVAALAAALGAAGYYRDKLRGCERREPGEGTAESTARCRAWIETHRFKVGETRLVAEALDLAGCEPAHPHAKPHSGERTGHAAAAAWAWHPSANKSLAIDNLDKWDVLWTPTRRCLPVHTEGVRPAQQLNCLPGVYRLTGKTTMPRAVQHAFAKRKDGLAVTPVPETFFLPEEETQWRAAMESEPSSRWMLKNSAHLGRDLRIVSCLDPDIGGCGTSESVPPLPRASKDKPYTMAQRYIDPPLILDNGRKFGLRLWVMLQQTYPTLKASLYSGGLVLFAEDEYDSDGGGLTNAALNTEAEVWSIETLREYWGTSGLESRLTFDEMWEKIRKCLQHAMAANAHGVAEDALEVYAQAWDANRNVSDSSFSILGADILIDAQLRPWLLEINGTPSLKATEGSVTEGAKRQMLADLFMLVGVDDRPATATAFHPLV